MNMSVLWLFCQVSSKKLFMIKYLAFLCGEEKNLLFVFEFVAKSE